MNTYSPDRWVVLQVTDLATGESLRKVLVGWHGGFVSSHRWKLSSNVLAHRELPDHFEFDSACGSTYRCAKRSYGFSAHMEYALANLQDDAKGQARIAIDTTFEKICRP